MNCHEKISAKGILYFVTINSRIIPRNIAKCSWRTCKALMPYNELANQILQTFFGAPDMQMLINVISAHSAVDLFEPHRGKGLNSYILLHSLPRAANSYRNVKLLTYGNAFRKNYF